MSLTRMQALITPEQRQWLVREADQRSTSATAVLRDAIDVARGVRPQLARLAAFERLEALTQGWVGRSDLTPTDIESALLSRYPDLDDL